MKGHKCPKCEMGEFTGPTFVQFDRTVTRVIGLESYTVVKIDDKLEWECGTCGFKAYTKCKDN